MSETRIVLVKPGDILIFGNVGNLGQAAEVVGDHLRGVKDELGLAHIIVFTEDIDLAAVPGA